MLPDNWEAQFSHLSDAEWAEALTTYQEQNKSAPLSWKRIITHELMHAAYGSENGLINDHHKIIGYTNDIMRGYGEIDRDPYDDRQAY